MPILLGQTTPFLSNWRRVHTGMSTSLLTTLITYTGSSGLIWILNKVDKLEEQNWIEKYKLDFPDSVAISALKKENVEGLLSRISQKIPKTIHKISLSIPLDRMNLVDLIYREGQVEKIKYTSKSIAITAQIPDTLIHKFEEYLKK